MLLTPAFLLQELVVDIAVATSFRHVDLTASTSPVRGSLVAGRPPLFVARIVWDGNPPSLIIRRTHDAGL